MSSVSNHPIFLLPIGDTISTAWAKVKGAKGTVWAGIGISILIVITFSLFSVAAEDIHPIAKHIINFAEQVVNILLQLGFLYLAIQRAYDLPITFTQIFRAFNLNMIVNLILMYLLKIALFLPIIIFATACFIIGSFGILFSALGVMAGIYLGVRLIFAVYFILDKETVSPWLAIKLSYAATKGNFWRLILLFIIQIGFYLAGTLLLLIGLIWVIPLNLIMLGVIYKQLLINIPDKI